MKNNRIILIIGLVLSLTFFTSCDDDKDDNSNSIVGTSWSFSDEVGENPETKTIMFETETELQLTVADSSTTVSLDGTYEYTSPNIDITIEEESFSGTISENKMTFDDTVYTKL